MSKFYKILAAAVLSVLAIGSLSACATAPMDMSSVAAVIDVRTADEWNSGHLDGAVNIDIQSADFATKIDSLDHAANYVIYCHSGRRAGIALTNMQSLGFTGTLTNAGGIDEAAAATGLPIVQ